MASKNPLAGAFIASNEAPQAEPHARHLHHPTHKHKVAHKGRPSVEMPRGHGARASAAGRDAVMHIPGKKEPSGIQSVGNPANRTAPKSIGKMVKPHRGPGPVR